MASCRLFCSSGANGLLHHGAVALRIGVDRDVVPPDDLFVLRRVGVAGLSVRFGHFAACGLDLRVSELDACVVGHLLGVYQVSFWLSIKLLQQRHTLPCV